MEAERRLGPSLVSRPQSPWGSEPRTPPRTGRDAAAPAALCGPAHPHPCFPLCSGRGPQPLIAVRFSSLLSSLPAQGTIPVNPAAAFCRLFHSGPSFPKGFIRLLLRAAPAPGRGVPSFRCWIRLWDLSHLVCLQRGALSPCRPHFAQFRGFPRRKARRSERDHPVSGFYFMLDVANLDLCKVKHSETSHFKDLGRSG